MSLRFNISLTMYKKKLYISTFSWAGVKIFAHRHSKAFKIPGLILLLKFQ